jgi:hypothetical protein
MPNGNDEEAIETTEGDAGNARVQSDTEAEAESDLPPEFFDERQLRIGTTRKEAGPPLEGGDDFPLEEAEEAGVPPTEADESQVDTGGGE